MGFILQNRCSFALSQKCSRLDTWSNVDKINGDKHCHVTVTSAPIFVAKNCCDPLHGFFRPPAPIVNESPLSGLLTLLGECGKACRHITSKIGKLRVRRMMFVIYLTGCVFSVDMEESAKDCGWGDHLFHTSHSWKIWHHTQGRFGNWPSWK